VKVSDCSVGNMGCQVGIFADQVGKIGSLVRIGIKKFLNIAI
jgi:hypothetical protein